MPTANDEIRAFDPRELLRRYHRARRGLPIDGEDDVFFRYRPSKRIETHLKEASWLVVLIFAFVNAIGI
ncbi:MAG: hypothetical protein KDD44_14410, partial [Bdellovibrionales bacterium]|nr:hypothetical protein [Bdellovibrionales bacterium]